MPDSIYPLVIEPIDVNSLISEENPLIVDLCQADNYINSHVPGAVYLNYEWIVRSEKPVMGLLPDSERLARLLNAYGIGKDTHVIAYDDEGGGRASRFLWTLQCIGHTNVSLIDGGLQAWHADRQPLENQINFPTPLTQARDVSYIDAPIADKQYILEHMNRNNVVILDTRSLPEHNGTKVFAARGGHIPGAVHYEWTNAMDKNNNLKLRDPEQLKIELSGLGVTPDKTIVCHCQSHHRSAHTCILLNSLGYENVKGYPGSWSDWGNDPATPIE